MQKRRATALFDVTRAIAGAQSLDEAVAAALSQADSLFETQCALVLEREGVGRAHPSGSLALTEQEVAIATCAMQRGVPVGRSTLILPSAAALHVPLLRAGKALGAFVVAPPPGREAIPEEQRDLIDGFAAQIALLVEREQLRAAGEREKLLAESERLHRTLFDSVSHELKTPLAVLRVAGEKLDTDNASLRSTLVREVRTATHRLNRLVGNLLDQNRLESGVLRPQLDWCDARDLINAARRTAGDSLEARELRFSIADDLPCFRADAPLTEHALANLLLNACVHTPPDTPILIGATLEDTFGGTRICLRVSDRGRGIAPALRQQLFQKFCRGEAAKPGGLGLGLSIVRGFMVAQGGDVACDENPGGGAIFSLYFPYHPHGTVPADER
jgi:two-component system sensor histidine kinase KdpD